MKDGSGNALATLTGYTFHGQIRSSISAAGVLVDLTMATGRMVPDGQAFVTAATTNSDQVHVGWLTTFVALTTAYPIAATIDGVAVSVTAATPDNPAQPWGPGTLTLSAPGSFAAGAEVDSAARVPNRWWLNLSPTDTSLIVPGSVFDIFWTPPGLQADCMFEGSVSFDPAVTHP
jgi:hypothetical protein